MGLQVVTAGRPAAAGVGHAFEQAVTGFSAALPPRVSGGAQSPCGAAWYAPAPPRSPAGRCARACSSFSWRRAKTTVWTRKRPDKMSTTAVNAFTNSRSTPARARPAGWVGPARPPVRWSRAWSGSASAGRRRSRSSRWAAGLPDRGRPHPRADRLRHPAGAGATSGCRARRGAAVAAERHRRRPRRHPPGRAGRRRLTAPGLPHRDERARSAVIAGQGRPAPRVRRPLASRAYRSRDPEKRRRVPFPRQRRGVAAATTGIRCVTDRRALKQEGGAVAGTGSCARGGHVHRVAVQRPTRGCDAAGPRIASG